MSKDEKCGHVNRHSYGVNHKLDNLACEKAAGHDGLHGALHDEETSRLGEGVSAEQAAQFEYIELPPQYAGQAPRGIYKGRIWREWSDAAGTPAKDIVPVSPGIEIIQADLSKF